MLPPQPAALRVLIVDDNVDAARSLGALCEHLGHQWEFAADGGTALDAAHRLLPDVILLDLTLPRVDGFEVIRRLRAEPAFRHLLIIAVTGAGSDEDRERARDAGVDHYLVKPADPAFIASLLHRPR